MSYFVQQSELLFNSFSMNFWMIGGAALARCLSPLWCWLLTFPFHLVRPGIPV